MAEKLPRKFGKCLVVKHLGKGATAVVLLARHEGLSIPVAVKVLRKPLSDENPSYAARFLREARMAARLDHPNIVRVIDCGIEQGYHYMVMDYVDGPNCLEKLQEEPQGLDWKEAVEIVRQSSLGLGYAASRDVIHRDVKPSNLMIDSTGRVRVTDLGLAKMTVKGVVELTQELHTVGTPSYMSPEQIRSASGLDLRSDIYSLGATFYHLVTGQPPFSGEGPMDVVAKHLTDRLVPPTRIRPSLPDVLTDVIGKMMAKNAEDRYQDYATLGEDLQNLLDGNPISAAGFNPAGPSAADERELRSILADLDLSDGLEVDVSNQRDTVADADPEPGAAPQASSSLALFGPEDLAAYQPPPGQDMETAVMPKSRRSHQKSNAGLIAAVVAGIVLTILAIVLIVIIASG